MAEGLIRLIFKDNGHGEIEKYFVRMDKVNYFKLDAKAEVVQLALDGGQSLTFLYHEFRDSQPIENFFQKPYSKAKPL